MELLPTYRHLLHNPKDYLGLVQVILVVEYVVLETY